MTRLICRTVANGDVVLTTAKAVRRVVEQAVDYDRSGVLENLEQQHEKLLDLVSALFDILAVGQVKDILNANHYETFRLE